MVWQSVSVINVMVPCRLKQFKPSSSVLIILASQSKATVKETTQSPHKTTFITKYPQQVKANLNYFCREYVISIISRDGNRIIASLDELINSMAYFRIFLVVGNPLTVNFICLIRFAFSFPLHFQRYVCIFRFFALFQTASHTELGFFFFLQPL